MRFGNREERTNGMMAGSAFCQCLVSAIGSKQSNGRELNSGSQSGTAGSPLLPSNPSRLIGPHFQVLVFPAARAVCQPRPLTIPGLQVPCHPGARASSTAVRPSAMEVQRAP